MYLLNEKEKSCLKVIAKRKRIDYLKKNKNIYLEDDIDMIDENIFVSNQNVEKEIELKCDRDICAYNIEKIFTDTRILKSIGTLTLKEKLVFFSYYVEEKTDKEIGEALNIKGDTIRKMRKRARIKVLKYYENLKEEKGSNV